MRKRGKGLRAAWTQLRIALGMAFETVFEMVFEMVLEIVFKIVIDEAKYVR